MNGAYQIINFDDIEFTTGTAELVVGAYKKITDTAKRFVITHLNLDDETYKDIQLTFENVEGTFVGTGVVNGKLAVVSIASTDQVTVSLNDIAGDITELKDRIDELSTNTSVVVLTPTENQYVLPFTHYATLQTDISSNDFIGVSYVEKNGSDTTPVSWNIISGDTVTISLYAMTNIATTFHLITK